MQLAVGFPQEWDLKDWENRYIDGALPDRWPYGLDRLDEYFTLLPVPVSSKDLIPKAGRRVREGLALGWDESSIARLVGSRRFQSVVGGVIWNTDDATGLRDAIEKAVYRRMIAKADALWCLSRPQVKLVETVLGRACPPVHFLPFGIDVDFYTSAPLPERPLVLSAGGDRDRDIPTLFRALAEVKASRPDVDVVVQTASDIPAPAGVTKVPRLSHVELRDLYSRASVIAIATHRNAHASGMTVALEAMSTGRPVVITETPGMDDYVTDATGWLTPVADSRAMSNKIVTLLDDRARMQTLGANGREKVLGGHSTATMARNIGKIVHSAQLSAGARFRNQP